MGVDRPSRTVRDLLEAWCKIQPNPNSGHCPLRTLAAGHDAAFARELPRFLAAVWRVFNEYELAGYVAMQKPAVRRQLRTLLYFS